MDNLSDYIPLLIIIGSVIYSIVKETGKKKREEIAKTILPGRKSGEEVSPPETFHEVKSMKIETQKKKLPLISQSVISPVKQTICEGIENMAIEYEESESLLNIEDMDEVKKAFIYTEIFNRKKN
jgi:hypothetical protein